MFKGKVIPHLHRPANNLSPWNKNDHTHWDVVNGDVEGVSLCSRLPLIAFNTLLDVNAITVTLPIHSFIDK